MKVICRDSFDRELPGRSDERLIAAGCTKYWAERIAKALNDTSATSGPEFFVAVEDDYQLVAYTP